MIPLVIVAGGVWVFQDSLASILYYLKTDENWHFNQALRIIRAVWGLVIIACGVLLSL